jgi:hypothetical protein
VGIVVKEFQEDNTNKIRLLPEDRNSYLKAEANKSLKEMTVRMKRNPLSSLSTLSANVVSHVHRRTPLAKIIP